MVVLINYHCHDKQIYIIFHLSLQIHENKTHKTRDIGNKNIKTKILLILICHHTLI